MSSPTNSAKSFDMFAATPSIGFPEFKMMGKMVTDFAVAEATERFGPAGSSARAGGTAQHATTANATWENRQGLIVCSLEKALRKGRKSRH
jgi:hypothetical protein